jgi:hypothetical protein
MLQFRDGLTARDIAAVWPAATVMAPLPIPETLSAEPRPNAAAEVRVRPRTLWRAIAALLKPRVKQRSTSEGLAVQ